MTPCPFFRRLIIGGLTLFLVSAICSADVATQSMPGEIRMLGGVPTLYSQGEPYGPMMVARCRATFEQLEEFSKHNFEIYQEQVPLIGLPGESPGQTQVFDERIARVLAMSPNARIMVRFKTLASDDFSEKYPDELVRFEDGRTDHFIGRLPIKGRAPLPAAYPSLASEVWRSQTEAAIRHLVDHVNKSDYADRVLGYMICGGSTGEWNDWGPGKFDDNDHGIDYSAPMMAKFREYLRGKYPNVSALRRAWVDDAVTFESAAPPLPAECEAMKAGMFYDPATQRRVQDFYEVRNRAMSDSLLRFARAAKEESGGRQLVGAFFGYLLHTEFMSNGHLFAEEVMSSPFIDFLAAPPQYKYCGPGDATLDRFFTASMHLHEKLWWREVDMKTSYADPYTGSNPRMPQPTLPQSLGLLKREFSAILAGGNQGWWYPIEKTYYNHPPILNLMSEMQVVGKAALDFPRDSGAEIAVVADFNSLRYSAPAFSAGVARATGGPFMTLLEPFRVQEISRIGAATDFISLDDVLSGKGDRYKLVIMLNAFALNEHQREAINRQLRRKGRTIVWMFAPGFFNADKPGHEADVANVSALLRQPMHVDSGGAYPYQLLLSADGKRAFPDWPAKLSFGGVRRPEIGTDAKTKTVTWIDHPVPDYPQRFRAEPSGDSVVLAQFASDGQPAMTRRVSAGVTEYWVGALLLPVELLQDIARQAGCHLLSDTPAVMYANRSFIAYHAAEGGRRTFNLADKADVVDAFTGEVIVRQAKQFTVSVEAFDTKLWFVGDADAWAKSVVRDRGYFGGHTPAKE